MGNASQSVAGGPAPSSTRWAQLAVGIVGMVAIANLQYGWTLFVNPIDSKFHWGKAAIQVAFTLFVLAETWLVPFEGYLIGGVGAGIVYGTSVGNALKWFPERRGLAAGLTAAAFGAGSALTIVPIANLINRRGYEAAFVSFGIG